MKRPTFFGWLGLCAALVVASCEKAPTPLFTVHLPEELSSQPLDGRLLVLISNNTEQEPRFQISNGPETQLIFGMDVHQWQPGTDLEIHPDVPGYPLKRFSDIPKGTYQVQTLFYKYETYARGDGEVLLLPPMDKGEGIQWNLTPGNLFSIPRTLSLDASGKTNHLLELTEEIPPIPAPEDTKYIKHIRMRSELLSEFWGRDVYLGAHVLLPEGFDQHPEARYPLAIFHGHYPHDFSGFREDPPDPDLRPDTSARFGISGYNRIVQQEAHDFYKKWTSKDFPRMLIIEIQHPTPFFDDSYAVNSVNTGPYGDAITYELIPYIEQQFRGIGEGWARFLYGGSTGGWIALANQIFYPDEYNGCFSACPDPIDFRAFTLLNLFTDKNAYYVESPWKRTEIPRSRDTDGYVTVTLREVQQKEQAIGTKGRSCGQRDVWLTTFGPKGEDGYPKHPWDKVTGEIDTSVVRYMIENYDLRYILERDWASLGPKLQGKINIYVGDMDNSYLNNAVMYMENFLKSTSNPQSDAFVDYGDGFGHCWNGDHDNPNYLTRLRYNWMYVPQMLKRMEDTAPPGADLSSWRY